MWSQRDFSDANPFYLCFGTYPAKTKRTLHIPGSRAAGTSNKSTLVNIGGSLSLGQWGWCVLGSRQNSDDGFEIQHQYMKNVRISKSHPPLPQTQLASLWERRVKIHSQSSITTFSNVAKHIVGLHADSSSLGMSNVNTVRWLSFCEQKDSDGEMRERVQLTGFDRWIEQLFNCFDLNAGFSSVDDQPVSVQQRLSSSHNYSCQRLWTQLLSLSLFTFTFQLLCFNCRLLFSSRSAGECTAAAFLLPLLFLPTLVNTVAFTDNDYWYRSASFQWKT